MAKIIPAVFILLSFSLNKSLPASADKITIDILTTAKTSELFKLLLFSASIKKYREPKFTTPSKVPRIRVGELIEIKTAFFLKAEIRRLITNAIKKTIVEKSADSV